MTRWKKIILMAVLFLSGVLTGVVASRAALAIRFHRLTAIGPLGLREAAVHTLGRELHLTSEQRASIAPVIASAQQQLAAIRNRIQPDIDQVFTNAISAIKPSLKAGQSKQLDDFYARTRNHWAESLQPVPP